MAIAAYGAAAVIVGADAGLASAAPSRESCQSVPGAADDLSAKLGANQNTVITLAGQPHEPCTSLSCVAMSQGAEVT